MKRYIKAQNQWIDTLEQLKAGFYYYVIDGCVYYMSDEYAIENKVGELQDETDDKLLEEEQVSSKES